MSIRRLLGDVRGATAVEFAMTAPLFFGLIFTIVEGGQLLRTQIGMQHVVEIAARCASLQTKSNPNPCQGSDVLAFAKSEAKKLSLPVPASTFAVHPSTPGSCGVQVTANYTFVFIGGYLGRLTIPLSAQSCFPQFTDPESDADASAANSLVRFV